MSDVDRLVKRHLSAFFDGRIDETAMADMVVRIADSDIKVKPGFVPMTKRPNKDGFIPVRYVDSPLKIGAAAAKRRRQNTIRAPGLPQARQKTDNGFAPVASWSKVRDYKSRKHERAKRAINSFIAEVDRRLRSTRVAKDALKTRDLMSYLLKEHRVLFSSKERREMFGVMRSAAHRVRKAKRAGVL